MGWYEETFRATIALLTASVLLIVSGLAGFGGSLALAAGLVAVAGVLFAGRKLLRSGPELAGHDLGYYGDILWVGPLVGSLVVLWGLTATPAELQALGGIVGLVGMANYFLRPVYHIVYGLVGPSPTG